MATEYQYFEIRTAIDFGDHTESFKGAAQYCPMRGSVINTPEAAEQEARVIANEAGKTYFWTLYGKDEVGHWEAISDCKSFAAAYEVMNAILAPLAQARDLIYAADDPIPEELMLLANRFDDIINQSSTDERL